MRDSKNVIDISLWIDQHGTLVAAREFFHNDKTYVEGQDGLRYVVRVRNLTSARCECVLTVDGLDTRSGKEGSLAARGMLISAGSSYDYDGFRLNESEVAAFRFGSAGSSYAAQIGKPRNVGVIGLAVFEELVPSPPPSPVLARFPPPAAPPPADRARSLSSSLPPPSAPPPSSAPMAMNAPGGAPPPAPSSMPPPPSSAAPLGTSFGERRTSVIHSSPFDRASEKPTAMLAIRYESRDGLRALGIATDPPIDREQANPFPAEVGGCKPPPGWKG